jgi:arylsulfatase A-like enzyme
VSPPVELVDLPATLAELAGVRAPIAGTVRHGDGASFAAAFAAPDWQDPEPEFLENEFDMRHADLRSYVLSGVRSGRWKLILTERSLDRPPGVDDYPANELYDLARDPLETDNLFFEPDQFERVTELLGMLRDHARFLNEEGLRDSAPAVLAPEVEAQLERLGYLGG